MTTKRTREIFGDKMKHWKDAEVNEFIMKTSRLTEFLMKDGIRTLRKDEKNDKN